MGSPSRRTREGGRSLNIEKTGVAEIAERFQTLSAAIAEVVVGQEGSAPTLALMQIHAVRPGNDRGM